MRRRWKKSETIVEGGVVKGNETCLVFLFLRGPSLLFDLRLPLLRRILLPRDSLVLSRPLVPPDPPVVSRGFIPWRKECAPFGLVISWRGPAEGEDRLRNRIPWPNFSNSSTSPSKRLAKFRIFLARLGLPRPVPNLLSRKIESYSRLGRGTIPIGQWQTGRLPLRSFPCFPYRSLSPFILLSFLRFAHACTRTNIW